jgi:uncharacterized membrane protein (DUF4010 family)
MTLPVEFRFLLALALGFLVGLERESVRLSGKGNVLAGVRTHSIISLFGFGCAWLAQARVEWAVPAGMATVAALAVSGYLAKLKDGHVGWTSEISTALTFVTGALALLADVWVPMALGVVNALLLSEKAELEAFVERLDKTEFLAVLKFLLITVIILPALPDREYTMYKLNPARIWLVVVMVSSIGFVGYVLVKKFGARSGLWLSGLLGGVVSSTAVCVAMGRLAQKDESRAGSALQAALLASSVMYLRILVLVWILNPVLIWQLWWKLVLLSSAGVALALWTRSPDGPREEHGVSSLPNPFEIRPALVFAGIFVLLSSATVLVRMQFGDRGLLALAAVVGIVDIDPFILSLISGAHPYSASLLAAMLLAMMSNTVMKGGSFAALARPRRREAALRFGILAVLHVPLMFVP